MELNEEYLNELEQERLDGMEEMIEHNKEIYIEESFKAYKEELERIIEERQDGLEEMIEHNAKIKQLEKHTEEK